jgi:hypothetical protein
MTISLKPGASFWILKSEQDSQTNRYEKKAARQ